MKPRAVYYDILKYQQKNLDLLNENFDTIVLNNPTENTNKILESVELLFAPLGFKVDKLYINRCPNLKVIASNTTGIPHIDKTHADMNNISICALHNEQTFLETITPTSEHTVGLILSILRRIPSAHYAASNGNWDRRPWGSPMMVSRMTIGIIGMGRLGRQVQHIMSSFGAHVLFYDPYVQGSETDLVQMASKCNILSINAVVNNETIGLVDFKILNALPKNSIVVNTARGEILEMNALIDLLESGHLWGAAIDTIDGEYDLEFNKKFYDSRVATYARENNNLILTPHIGGSTIDAWAETEKRVIDKSIEILC
jgi:lactate dehydrogenase-like 2-hydroxyacid dehydrogenase